MDIKRHTNGTKWHIESCFSDFWTLALASVLSIPRGANVVVAAVDPGSTDITPLIHHPVLWASAAGVFAVVMLQSAIYFKAIRKAAPAADLTPGQVKSSVRSGAVAAHGPSPA